MLVEIRAGEGGGDAEAFASELADAVVAYLRRTTPNLFPARSGTTARTITIAVPGPPDPTLERIAGTHRVQRIPANDKTGRRHTSTATVAVLADRPTGRPAPVTREDCDIVVFRGSGPGGQHRNKTATNARVTHRATGITVVGSAGRSQHQNIESALAEIAARLAALSAGRAEKEVNGARRAQIASGERPVKQLTWNTQRMVVHDHQTGGVYPLKQLAKGRFDLLAG